MSTDTDAPSVDLKTAWRIHPQVSVRPEPFGALLYHFGTRKLSFLKDRKLLDVVRRLDDAPSVQAAMEGAGVSEAEYPHFCKALDTLARSSMVIERTTS